MFTRVVGAASSPLQLSGIKIFLYLDDWLVYAPSLIQVVEDTRRVVSHIQSLGLKVNVKKSYLEPRQQVVFVGLCLNSFIMSASITPQRVMNTLTLLDRLGRRLEMIPFRGYWA